MSKRSIAQLKTLTDQVIKTNNSEQITAAKDNPLRKDFLDSYLNLVDGGLVIDAEVGYSAPIEPSEDYSFATKKYVDDATESLDLTEYIKRDGTSDPTTGFIKIGDTKGFTTGTSCFIDPDNATAELDFGANTKYKYFQIFTNDYLNFSNENPSSLSGLQFNAAGFSLNANSSLVVINSDSSSNLNLFANNNLLSYSKFYDFRYGIGGSDGFGIRRGNLSFGSILKADNITGSSKTHQLPNASGTIALTSDIPSVSGFELTSNKTDSVTGNESSSTLYASIKGMVDWVMSLFFPSWVTLTYGSTVAWNTANKANPRAKLTATGDFTIDMTNISDAVSGCLKVSINTASAVTMTFDTSYTNSTVNTTFTTFTFPTGTGKSYFLYFIVDGTNIEWIIVDGTGSGGSLPTGTSGQIIVYSALGVGTAKTVSGDLTALADGSFNIANNKITYAMLKTTETLTILVTDSTQQAALLLETGWTGSTKTISGMAAGQWYKGTGSSGIEYRYDCYTAGTAIRTPLGQGENIKTINTITQPVFESYSDVGNGTTVETDLYSYSIPATGTLGNLFANGNKLIGKFTGIFVGSATATRQLRVKLGATTIFDSSTLVLASNSSWVIDIVIIRVSSTVVRYAISYAGANAVAPSVGEVTGLTLTSSNVLKLTGQAASTGAATNDIVAKLGEIRFIPQV